MVDKVLYEGIISPIYNYLAMHSIDDEFALSFPFPCIYGGKLLDVFFMYRQIKNEDNYIIKVDELLISNPYEKSVVARFETNYSSNSIPHSSSNLTYSKYLQLRDKYIQLYEKIRPFAFENSITVEQSKLLKLYLQTFSQLFDTQLRKAYCDLGEVFFKWSIIASGGAKWI